MEPKNEKEITAILVKRINKRGCIDLVNADPAHFDILVKLALQNIEKASWRSAWILGHCVQQQDPRLQSRVGQFLEAIPTKPDGHQRELLKILAKLDYPEDIEGRLFDHCISIWETLGKSPSVRIIALRVILKIVSNYPELWSEIEFLTEEHYLTSLSPGIRRSVEKSIMKVKKKQKKG